MKIIKSSKETTKQTMRFKCEKCGCEFECENDEYWDSQVSSLTWFTEKKYMTCCPECHKVVELSVPNYSCTISSGDTYTTNLSNICGTSITSEKTTPKL